MDILKIVFRVASVSVSLSSCGVLSHSAYADWGTNDVMKRQASFEVKDASIDDYILAASRAYKVNLILDSTRVPQDAPLTSQKIENFSMWSGLAFFVSRRGINAQPWGDGSTILLWQQPDLALLTRKLVESGEIKAPPADMPSQALLGSNQMRMQPLIATYFQKQKGWNGQGPFRATATFEELPQELRERLAVQTRAGIWNLVASRTSARWFSEDFWKSVRLRFIPGQDNTGKIRQELAVVGALRHEQDGPIEEEAVFISDPGSPFRFNRRGKTPPRQVALVTPDEVLANSSLAAPYQPAPAKGLRLDPASDVALSQKVTLELKRRPLDETLAALGEKVGVAVSLSPEMKAEGTLLTLGIAEMPAHEVMAALTRLLGLEWSKNAEGGYLGGRGTRTALETQLLQARKISLAPLKGETAARHARQLQEAGELLTEITLALGQAALAQPEGVAFTELPDELKSVLRLRVQDALAPDFAEAQSRLREKLDVLNGPWRLEVDAPEENVQRVTRRDGRQIEIRLAPRANVLSSSDQILTTFTLSEPAQKAQTRP